MVKQCCISLCKRTSKDNKETSFFEIPSGEERRKLWISILEPYAKIGRQAYVCSKHFNFEDIRVFDNGRKRLISNAVPIINMEVCVVRDCESKAPFHALSIAPALREKWLINLDRLDLLDSTVDSSLKVCSAHFRSSSYSYPGSKRLLRSAIPEPVLGVSSPFDEKASCESPDSHPDSPIATGEVTSPRECHDLVLKNTKATYGKRGEKRKYDSAEENSDQSVFRSCRPCPISSVDTFTTTLSNFSDRIIIKQQPEHSNDGYIVDHIKEEAPNEIIHTIESTAWIPQQDGSQEEEETSAFAGVCSSPDIQTTNTKSLNDKLDRLIAVLEKHNEQTTTQLANINHNLERLIGAIELIYK